MNKRLSIASEKLSYLKALNQQTIKNLDEIEFDDLEVKTLRLWEGKWCLWKREREIE